MASLLSAATAGCFHDPFVDTKQYRTPARYQRGLTIILPGIEGRSYLNENVASGLGKGGVPGAIEIYDWTLGGTVTWLPNLRLLSHNRAEAAKIAEKIVTYQNAYPGKPVSLVGHSGGGGVAVLALESLPPERKIALAMLLAPALSRDYDLRKALSRTDAGIWNYYSHADMGFLGLGTTVFGNIDGGHGPAAGAFGFIEPWGMDRADRALYGRMLHQQAWSPQMAEAGNYGLHTTWARESFVAKWLAPVVLSRYTNQTQYAADVEAPKRSP
jgi:pimeloyl-ACP methyl ester carboxylesterase